MNWKLAMDGRVMVYTDGSIYRIYPDGRLKLLPIAQNGTVPIWENGVTKNYYVSRLVAEAFIPNPSDYNIVSHLDGNVKNNSIDNLVWISGRERAIKAHERRKLYGKTQKERDKIDKQLSGIDLSALSQKAQKVVEYRQHYMSYAQIGKLVGCKPQSVYSYIKSILKMQKEESEFNHSLSE